MGIKMKNIEINESSEMTQALIECSDTGIFIVSGGKFVYVSQLLEKLSGYKAGELTGASSMEHVHPDDRENVRQNALSRLNGEFKSPYEYRFIKKDGSIAWVLGKVAPINLKGERAALGSFFDITERKQAEQALHESETKYKTLAENSLTGIYLNQNGRFVFVNQRFAEMHGYETEELIGMETSLLIHPDEQNIVKQRIKQMFEENNPQRTDDVRRLKKDGSTIYCQMMVHSIDHMGKPAIMGNVIDITERKKMEQSIEHLAYHDSLTDLPNRTLFNDRFSLAINNAHRYKQKVGVMVIDLDHFKEVNDSMGHDIGDQLLVSIGQRLKNSVRKSDTVSRLGGDEFILLFPGLKRETELDKIAQRIITSSRLPFNLGKCELYITVSMGISIYPADGQTIDVLTTRADEAMYSVKKSGRNSYSRCLNNSLVTV